MSPPKEQLPTPSRNVSPEQSEKDISPPDSDVMLRPNKPRICPAAAYLVSLQSKQSQLVMASFLSVVARIIGKEVGLPLQSFRDYDWSGLNRTQIQAIMGKLGDAGRSPATINTYLYAMRGVVREAWALGYVTHEHYQHCQSVKTVRGSRLPKGQVLQEDDISALLQVCSSDSSEVGVRDLAIFCLMLATGLRRAEVVSLEISGLNRVSGELRVLGKGNKERLAHLPPSILKHVNYWVDQVRGDAEGPLFCRILKGGQVTESGLSSSAILYLLDKRCQEAGIPLFSPHDLRRTFATMLLNEGEDLLVIRDAMGHCSVEITERYIVRDMSHVRAAVNKQGERLSALMP